MKKILFLLFGIASLYALEAQNPLAEVQGRLSVYLADDTTSVHIGKKAGVNQQSGSKRNTVIGTHAGRATDSHYDNTIVGYKAGMTLDGNNNSFFGSEAGNESIGGSNAFFGNLCGQTNNGWYNSFFGSEAGTTNNGSYNSFFGFEAGYVNTGEHNCLFGYEAGLSNESGSHNIYIGSRTGNLNQTGSHNVALGSLALKEARAKSYNVAVGDSSMYKAGANDFAMNQLSAKNVAIGAGSLWGKVDNTGSRSVALGYQAGYDGGNNSIFIGNEAGKNASIRNNALYVSNQAGDDPLIYGEFDNNLVRVNGGFESTGNVGINQIAPISQLTIKQSTSGDQSGIRLIDDGNNQSWEIRNGGTERDLRFRAFSEDGTNAEMTVEIHRVDGSYHIHSDRRLKRDVVYVSDLLSKILEIRPAEYQWVDKPEQVNPSLGVIAQELELIFPGIVSTNEDGYKLVNYDALGVLAVQAIKEQQAIIEKQQRQINQILSMIDSVNH